MERIYARVQRWARALTAARLRRYQVPLEPKTRALLGTAPAELDWGKFVALLGVLCSFQPWNYIRTSWLGDVYNRFIDRDTLKRRILIQNIREDLVSLLEGKVTIITDYPTRRLYSRDLAEVPPFIERVLFRTTPHVVVQPRNAQDVAVIFKYAAQKRLSVFPRGISSWGYGGAIPTSNGILLDISALHGIEGLDDQAGLVTVQAGSRWGAIQDYLEPRGKSLLVYPSNRFATVGGWISTGGIGLNCYKYGLVGQWIDWIEVVFPNGDIRRLTHQDPAFDLMLDTEGHLGVITRVGLRVIPVPERVYSYLLYFRQGEAAFAFVSRMAARDIVPAQVKFLDANMMRAVNQAAAIKAANGQKLDWEPAPGFAPVVDEEDALFVEFDDPAPRQQFQALVEASPEVRLGKPYMANYLWNDRFSPMKFQTLGPGLLASEVTLPLKKAYRFIEAAKGLGGRYGTVVFIQAHVVRQDGDLQVAVLPLFTCDQRSLSQYMLLLPLVQMMTRLGIRLGGRPYGIGIWNVPFFASKFPQPKVKAMARLKEEVDPAGLLNPRKFSAIRSRFYNLPAKLFSPWFFSFGMDLMILFSPLLGVIVKSSRSHKARAEDLLLEASLRCTKCGNCAAVCPAYLVTGQEGVTARAKLRLIRRFRQGRLITRHEAERFFLCMHCAECARVCQSMLPLKKVWQEFESVLSERFTHPDRHLQEFVDRVTTSPVYLDLIGSEPYRFDLPAPLTPEEDVDPR